MGVPDCGVQMFTAVGKNVYMTDFEEPFLSASAEFYKVGPRRMLSHLRAIAVFVVS